MEVVAVLGASSDSSRYAYKAMEMLKEYGHEPIPVHPRESEVLGQKVIPSIGDLAESGRKIDTVTVYVNSAISQKYEKDFIKLAPKRVIFNPGAENPGLAKSLNENGIKVENACTLVLLRTSQY
jgi:predicted CoA-binding protein